MTNLGMQVMVEGLALAAFSMIRDYSNEPLAKALNAYVMQDEARHVAFGRLALREYYPQLTNAERLEREEFVVYASYLMRDRFLAEEVWENIGLDPKECISYVESSEMMQSFRRMLFSRIVPTVKDLGLFGPKVRAAFEDMGVIDFQALDPEDLSAADEEVARDIDRRRAQLPEQAGGAGVSLADVDLARAEEVSAITDAPNIAARMSLLGTESAFEVLARARALEAKGRSIIHLEIGEPDFDTPAHIVQAAVDALHGGFTHYVPAAGLPEVREAV